MDLDYEEEDFENLTWFVCEYCGRAFLYPASLEDHRINDHLAVENERGKAVPLPCFIAPDRYTTCPELDYFPTRAKRSRSKISRKYYHDNDDDDEVQIIDIIPSKKKKTESNKLQFKKNQEDDENFCIQNMYTKNVKNAGKYLKSSSSSSSSSSSFSLKRKAPKKYNNNNNNKKMKMMPELQISNKSPSSLLLRSIDMSLPVLSPIANDSQITTVAAEITTTKTINEKNKKNQKKKKNKSGCKTCSVCHKTFSNHQNLIVHLRTHDTKDYPYACRFSCGKCFINTSNRTVHERTHTNENPYKCNCGKSFKTSSNLKIHQKVHDRPQSSSSYNTHLKVSSKLFAKAKKKASY